MSETVAKLTADPARAAATQGAQVILDPKSDAAIGAKGGAAANMQYNTDFRDQALEAAGFDPSGPSAQLTDRPPDAPPVDNVIPRSELAPVNIDVPAVTQSGTTLSCTMGNWTGEPTSYSYQWQLNGTDAGTNAATYDVKPGDVGETATCIVTATNAIGSTTAPPSNAVVVA